MRQLNEEYGGCVYVTRKLRKHEKEAKERADAAEAAAAAAARAASSNSGADKDAVSERRRWLRGCWLWIVARS